VVETQSTGAYAGSLGDGLTFKVDEHPVYAEGDDGATGDAIFTSAAATFTGDIPATGGVPDTDTYLLIGSPGPGEVLRQVLTVVDGTTLIIETGEGVGLTGLTWSAGEELATGTDGATDGAGTTFTSASATFTTSIPNTFGVPNQTTYIEIGTDGVYEVTAVVDDNTLTITPAATFSLSSQTYTVIGEVATDTDGATGTLSQFVSPSAEFTVSLAALTASDLAVLVSGTGRTVASVVGDFELAMTDAFGASASSLSYEVVDDNRDLSLALDEEADTVTLKLARVDGVSTSSFSDVEDAITNSLNTSYDADVAAAITASLGGAGATTLTASDVGEFPFDGGSDDEQILVDADLIGSATPTGKIYVSFKALRVDVSAAADDPSLLSFERISDIEDEIGPISTDNPLALACYFALTNSPTNAIKALGISAVSASKPDGTLEAYQEALEFLEGKEVYALAPLTQDGLVHQAFQTHVDSMSSAENKGERIVFINRDLPEFSNAEVIASGSEGNTGASFSGDATADFTASTNFTDAGVEAGDILVVSSLAGSDDSPEEVNGTDGLFGLTVVSIGGDDFTLVVDATDASADWDELVDVSFTVYRPGSAIDSASEQLDALDDVGPGFEDRRVFFVWPDAVVADIDGTATEIEGFYLAAAIAGKIGEQSPSQAFTNLTLSGFSSLKHSNNYFTNSQLDELAGAGTFIVIQESANTPLKIRHQLATDVSTIQRRELSITKAIDYTAKFLRLALSKRIGKFNITQSFLDGLATTVQSLGRFLVESQVLSDFQLSSIAVDEDAPDTVNITVSVLPFFPCNYIALTISI
jgi:hypothetical protein